MNPDKWIDQNTIFLCISGSTAYGLATENSDVDVRGVCIPPPQYFFGLNRFEQKDSWPDGSDKVIYGIQKFAGLALNCNPNIIELMFMPEDCIQLKTPQWDMLVAHRSLFLSRQAAKSYMGYAMSQLKRITNGRINIPRENRNPERARMEAAHGYDCKHASHLMRLLYQGAELLSTGSLTVRLQGVEREVCRGLKAGEYSYEGLLEMVNNAKGTIRGVEIKSTLPKQPDRDKINQLLVDIIRQFQGASDGNQI